MDKHTELYRRRQEAECSTWKTGGNSTRCSKPPRSRRFGGGGAEATLSKYFLAGDDVVEATAHRDISSSGRSAQEEREPYDAVERRPSHGGSTPPLGTNNKVHRLTNPALAPPVQSGGVKTHMGGYHKLSPGRQVKFSRHLSKEQAKGLVTCRSFSSTTTESVSSSEQQKISGSPKQWKSTTTDAVPELKAATRPPYPSGTTTTTARVPSSSGLKRVGGNHHHHYDRDFSIGSDNSLVMSQNDVDSEGGVIEFNQDGLCAYVLRECEGMWPSNKKSSSSSSQHQDSSSSWF